MNLKQFAIMVGLFGAALAGVLVFGYSRPKPVSKEYLAMCGATPKRSESFGLPLMKQIETLRAISQSADVLKEKFREDWT
jgi:hypothetical protein